MKLQDLFEQQKVDITLEPYVTRLYYSGTRTAGYFDASMARKLPSLLGSPEEVDGYYSCAHTAILSLKGAPKRVGRWFSCIFTKITSLEGAPEYVGDDFRCYNTNITSLQNIHKQVKYIGGKLSLPHGVKSHVLGVMYIKGLRGAVFIDSNEEQKQVENIINRHLPGGNVHDVQEELLEAGLKGYARL